MLNRHLNFFRPGLNTLLFSENNNSRYTRCRYLLKKDIKLRIERYIKVGIYWRAGHSRGGSRTAATSKMERFVIIVNGWKPLTIITKRSILDVAAVLDPPLA